MTSVRYTTDGGRSITWTESGFDGDYVLRLTIEALAPIDTDPPPGFTAPAVGSADWAGAQIARAAQLLGLRGEFTWDPPPPVHPSGPELVY